MILIPAFVPAPAKVIEDELQARAWTALDLAAQLEQPESFVTALLEAREVISPVLALKLGAVFGTSAELWLGLENAYQLHLARQNPQARVSSVVPPI